MNAENQLIDAEIRLQENCIERAKIEISQSKLKLKAEILKLKSLQNKKTTANIQIPLDHDSTLSPKPKN